MSVAPLRDRSAYKALERHHAEIANRHLRDLFAEDPGRGERLVAEAAGLYLDYSKNRVTDETLRLLRRPRGGVGPARSGATRCSRGEHINVSEDRAVLHVALRMPRGASLVVDGVDVVEEVNDGPRPDERLRRLGAVRAVDGPHRQADQQRRQHRDRRLGPRAGDGLRGAAPLLAARHDLPVRLQRRLDRLRRGDPGPVRRRDAVHRLVEDLRHAGDAHQRHLGPRLAGRGGSATRRRSPGISSRCRPTPSGSPQFGIDTANMFGFWDWVGGRYSMDSAIGLSTMVAVGPANFREMLAGFHDMDEHFRTAPRLGQPAGPDGPAGGLVRGLLRRRDRRRDALRPVPEALPRLPAAADDGVQRQARHAPAAGRSTTRPGAVYWGEPGTNGQHSFYQLHPPGHQAGPRRSHRVRQEPQPAARPPRHPVLQRLRPGPGARLRQDRGGGAGRGHARQRSCRTG